MQKPTIWQRSTKPFWDDEHISKGMLEAHLNPDWDAASRKFSTMDRSVKWLSSIIPPRVNILDLGCGPGLYAKRLSDMGYRVTGMDFSRRSIEYAKNHDSKTEYIYKNYLEIDYTDSFDAVLLIYCDFAALTPDERHTLLQRVYQALRPGGLFIFDVFTEKLFTQKVEKTAWTLYDSGGFWNAEPHICLDATYLYDNNTVAADQHIVVTNGGVTEYLIWDTAYTIQKSIDEVTPFGFQMNGVFDDVCGRPYTGEGETLCFIFKKEC